MPRRVHPASRPESSLGALLVLAAFALPAVLTAQAAPRAELNQAINSTVAIDASTSAAVAPELFKDLRYRMVGPNRGGRVTALAGVGSEPHTFYMGVASGGVWKTTDAGGNWEPITDGQIPLGSIGAIQVAESNPDIIYVGTGSDGIRSNVSIGRGVYKSTDAGKTWSFVGLHDVGQIGAVRLNPTNPDIVYVAAVGNPFKPNVERGVFRTRDGGRTWKKVLFVSDSTGAADVELQPGNPDVVYAWMWRGERKPWTIISGAREGGFYKSTDGGDHWTKITTGLPNELIGKGNLGVSADAPSRIYALIEAKPGGGLYRSDDAGAHWSLASSNQQLVQRPFYYTTLGVDPTDADVVYAGAEGFFKSTDGGKTFRSMSTPHGDNHDIWINPHDGQIMVQANDGGANVSLNGGETWSTQDNQPTAEIYQIAVDNQTPYRIYGAQQDASTVIVPSLPLGSGQSDEWRTGPGCETGPIIPHPTNPDTVYGSCKGQFGRMNLTTGQEKAYWVGAQSLYGNYADELKYRFQRVSPMEISPFDPGTIYYGSQYVHRTHDEGVTWERISPDLTANDPRYRHVVSGTPITRDMTGEEMYATLYAIRESPLERGVIWTGANDGPFYVTRDDGHTWTNITPKDLPPGGRVQNIEPSPHRKGSAYYAVYRYLLGDFKPYIYRTDDYGKSWKLLTDGTNGIPADYPTRVVREDPDREGLLYAGTEFGMFISFDNGGQWQPFQQNLPATPITDLAVHDNDLIVSTQGRSFWIMNDLTPLRQLNTTVASAPVHLYTPATAMRMRYRGGGRSAADPQYPPAGAVIDYSLGMAPSSPLKLEILDGSGTVIKTFSSASDRAVQAGRASGQQSRRRRGGGGSTLPATEGLNRFVWDMAYPGPRDGATGEAGGRGPMAPPGQYQVRLTLGDHSETQPLTLVTDPRVTQDGVTSADLRAQFEHNLRARDLVSASNRAVWRLNTAIRRLTAEGRSASSVGDTLKKLRAIEATLLTPRIRYSSPGLEEHISYLYGMNNRADQKVGHDAIERYAELKAALEDIVRDLDAALGPDSGARSTP